VLNVSQPYLNSRTSTSVDAATFQQHGEKIVM